MYAAPAREPVHHALHRWATGAPVHLLQVLAWSGTAGAAGVLALDPFQWPVATGLGALAGLGATGLMARRSREPAGWASRLEGFVFGVTLVLALVALGVAFAVFLGPAPHF